MFLLKWNYFLLLFFFHGYYCQRRITDGEGVTHEKRYVVTITVLPQKDKKSIRDKTNECFLSCGELISNQEHINRVYLLKASVSHQYYENWVCGGALVSTEYIVTSAACVTDVMHLYAIAGYKKYINDIDIYTDPCTKEKKKKIVFTCIPKDYELVYNKPEKWSYIDIAMVRVESPYDFSDHSYATVCSYTPAAIIINYESKYQEPGMDAIVLGWGHQTHYREEMDLTNLNQEMLQYAPVMIENKENCKKEYAVYEGMDQVIDQYMICTAEKGNLDDEGVVILKAPPTAQGCIATEQKLRGDSCEIIDGKIVLVQNARKDLKATNFTNDNGQQNFNNATSERKGRVEDLNGTHKTAFVNKLNQTVVNSRRLNNRRFGICQNDHGGPLVTWVGAHEVLIGVASTYKVTAERACQGPYLYTSTQCNGAFLDCVLRSDPNKTDTIRRAICNNLYNVTGFGILETHISWKDHPDGPADNEKNITEHASATKTNNGTLNTKDTKEEKNKTSHEHNTTKVDTNITNPNRTTFTHDIEISTLTTISKGDNVSDSTNTNVTSVNTAKSAIVILTSGSSTDVLNNTVTNVGNIADILENTTSTTKSENIVIKSDIDTVTTFVMGNLTTTTIDVPLKTEIISKAAEVTERAIPTRTTYLDNRTHKNFTS